MLFLRVFFSVSVLCLLHRYLADPFLRTTLTNHDGNWLLEFAIGFCSDLWVSFLVSIPVFMMSMTSILMKNRLDNLTRTFTVIWMITWTAFITAHQTYVEYFKHQIIPFHLSYIFDVSFLKANGSSNFEIRPLLIIILGSMAVYPIWKIKRHRSLNIQLFTFLSFAISLLGLRALQIEYRVQKFVPESLQMHFLERLIADLSTKKSLKKVSPEEWHQLAKVTGQATGTLVNRLSIRPAQSSEIVNSFKSRIDELKQQHKTVFLTLLVAESFRPADSGWTRDSQDPPSITPNFDSLSSSGIFYRNAYSNGTVTRAGQEACWCGVPTSTDTSLMRSFRNYPVECLPAKIAREKLGESTWIHGGDRKFDSQASFWRNQQVNHLVLDSDMPSSSPRTGWGISDVALFNQAVDVFAKKAKENPGSIENSMILSVTNHIPWNLPSDALPEIIQRNTSHPSHNTTEYFDQALGVFVDGLKQRELWDQTLFVIVSDHGNLETPRNQSYKKDDVYKFEKLLSHINLTISGGIGDFIAKKHPEIK
ncbi:MAG: LTA synthase family protein, partial [Proteobacteria bacterium]|nr:LTA synthase family protein [Pseudomonadota bacterium]